ncbi:MAG: HEAT repeat domain-containing protein [Phycisphaerales bacterium]|jgi:HEAT repeat protein|nr:HEAT repeat domain-containing protein [Phycisphaerales bacterium]
MNRLSITLLGCIFLFGGFACSSSPAGQRSASHARGAPDARVDALKILDAASRSETPLVRANAIEMLETQVEPLRRAVSRGIVDPNPGVRFAACMALGRQRLCGIADLTRPLVHDPSESVRAAAIFALAVCNEDIDQTPLAAMVLSTDRAIRANAAMVLGEIGNPTAAAVLREAMRRPLQRADADVVRASELGLAEALVQLGDRRHLETIRAAFFAPASQSELTALASQMAGRLQDRSLVPAMAALALAEGPRQAGPELRLIAAEALARIDPTMTLAPLAIELSQHQFPEVRMQAAFVLAWDRSAAGLAALEQLCRDADPRVQVAAAGAVLHRAGLPAHATAGGP